MTQRLQSLQHEYTLFVEQEIEHYKESVSRGVLLGIGDEAVQTLETHQQLALTELILCDEVDRIIKARLRLPTYQTWRRRRLRAIKDYSRPERWGLSPNEPLVRQVPTTSDGHVLVAGAAAEGPALYLAANGCAVTSVEAEEAVVERVISCAVDSSATLQKETTRFFAPAYTNALESPITPSPFEYLPRPV